MNIFEKRNKFVKCEGNGISEFGTLDKMLNECGNRVEKKFCPRL